MNMTVKDIRVNTFWKGEVQVKGLVEDLSTYRTQLHLKGSQVFDYSCSCAQGNSYRGMCGHAKALLASYRKIEKESAIKPVVTSQNVRFMIREYTNREVSRIISQGEEEKVTMFPRLIVNRQEVRLALKVGRGRKYVVRDLAVFAEAMEQEKYFEYGKGLSFHHTMDVFGEESRPLVQLVLELANVCREHYKQFQKNSFSSPLTLKDLNLSRSARDRFFSLAMGRPLEVEDCKGDRRRVEVKKENPALDILVRREGKDGVRVEIPKSIMCFSGENHLYVMDQGTLFCCDEEYTKVLSVFLDHMLNVFGAAGEILVNDKDMPLFYERVLRKLELLGLIKAKDLNLEDYKPEELRASFEFDSEGISQLSMKPTLSYGDFSFHPLEDEKVPRTVCRDVPGEFVVSRLITKYFKFRENDTKNLVIQDDDEAMYQLLTEGMEEFMALGEVRLSEAFKNLKVIPSPKVSLGVRTLDNWLELTIDAGGMSGAQLNRVLTEYSQKKRFCRMKNGQFLTLGDDGMMTVAQLIEGLSVGKNDLQSKKLLLPKYRAIYLDGMVKESSDFSCRRDPAFRAIVRGMKSVKDSDYEVPASLQPVLGGYQKVGFRWLRTLDFYGFGGILADEMGLGKTIQVIALLLDEKQKEGGGEEGLPSLIVCPASLVYNWESEIVSFAPELRPLPIVGNLSDRISLLEQLETGGFDVAITSYDLLKRDAALYQGRRFRFEIIDEAQYIKNAATQSAKAVKSVQAVTRFALTGTPIENRLSELWSIFDFLMPGFLFSYQKFKKIYEIPIVRDRDERALNNLHRMIGPFVMRRLKRDVLKELPDKMETVMHSKLGEKQKALYAANARLLKNQLEAGGMEAGRDKLQILAQLMRLRQICCDPSLCYENYDGESAKLETCIELIVNAVGGEHKILLFSQFASMLDIIAGRLDQEHIAYYKLTGATSKEERIRMVNAFHNDGVPVFLISLKAGGTGLNLTAADVVVHYDPWWNIAAQDQATDRAHRIGQENQVTVFKLITKHTVEENILKLQEAKKQLADQVITEGAVSLGGMSKEELLGILGDVEE